MALLDGAAELGDGQDRDVQVAGEDLEAAADLRYLLLAVLGTIVFAGAIVRFKKRLD